MHQYSWYKKFCYNLGLNQEAKGKTSEEPQVSLQGQTHYEVASSAIQQAVQWRPVTPHYYGLVQTEVN